MLPDYLESFPGQVVAFVLDEIRRFDSAATQWENQPDEQRQERLDQMADRAETMTQSLVDAVTQQGQDSVHGYIKQVVFEQAVKVVITAAKTDPHVLDLAQQAGGKVMLLLPQRTLDLEAPVDNQQALDLGGDPGWTPPADDDECICEKDDAGNIVGDYVEGCPVHDADDDEPGGDDEGPGRSGGSGGGVDDNLQSPPQNPASDDPDAENVG